MSNKRIGKGILLGIALLALALYLFYTCTGEEKSEQTEERLPVETPAPVVTVPEEVIPEPEIPAETIPPVPPVVKQVVKKEPAPVTDFPFEDFEEEDIIAVQPLVEEEIKEEEPLFTLVEPVVTAEETVAEVTLPVTKKNFDRGIQQGVFIPKGLWMVGGTFSYTEASIDDYKFLVMKNIGGKGYTFSLSPAFCYFFRDNIGVGGRLTYSRDMIDIGNLDLNLNEDLSFTIDNAYLVEHMFYGTAFLRMYTTIGNSRIIALFNEARLTYGGGQAKTFSGSGQSLDGLYQDVHRLQIGMSPGIAAFITNNLAIDVAVGVMGFDTKWIKQDHNKVIQGNYRSSSAKFTVDLFSINLGLSYYF